MKRKQRSSGGGANWMDTYGDMVTLLLCFFVLLYSMSTISEDNWRAIVLSFNPAAAMAPTESSGNDGPVADPETEDGMGLDEGLTEAQDEIDAAIEALYQMMSEYVSEQQMEDTVAVTKEGGKVYVQFNQAIFFDGNSPVLRSDAFPILEAVSEMLSQASNAIDEVRVIGHTAQEVPDEPNNVAVDRSLSSNRAVNVVVYIQEHSTLDPARLVSEGAGQWKPVASNDTSEERAKNRRVEMIVSGRDLEKELAEGVTTYEVIEGIAEGGSEETTNTADTQTVDEAGTQAADGTDAQAADEAGTQAADGTDAQAADEAGTDTE